MRRCRACGAGDEAGVALIEFALVAPILLVILLGMLDFGKAFNYWIDETHLAASGARWAVVNKNPGSGTLQQYIQAQGDTAELRSGGTSSVSQPAKVCVSFPNVGHVTPQVGDPVKVTVQISYRWLPIIGKRLVSPTALIGGSATMRLEALPTNYTAGPGLTGTSCP
jgi:Flp pilus assembly protein TadG